MKWMLLLFSILKPMFSSSEEGKIAFNPIEDFKNMVKDNAMNLIFVFIVSSVLASLFSAGIIIILLNIGTQLDISGDAHLNYVIKMGIILITIPSTIVYYLKSKYKDLNTKKVVEKIEQNHSHHPLADSLALLIQDLMKEREHKRSLVDTKVKRIPRKKKNKEIN